ncbi:zinc uptake regulator [Pseudomonas aeruginosa]|nr:zinc uptake regulator [Pseudomonas aeruginosa]
MYKIAPKTPLACQPHDHSQCVSTALAEADALCARQGVRLTELRRRVLELVWQSHKPLGAYDILAVLSETDGRRAADRLPRAGLPPGERPGAPHRLAQRVRRLQQPGAQPPGPVPHLPHLPHRDRAGTAGYQPGHRRRSEQRRLRR